MQLSADKSLTHNAKSTFSSHTAPTPNIQYNQRLLYDIFLGRGGLILLTFIYNIVVSVCSDCAVTGWDLTDSATHSDSGHAQRAFPRGWMPFAATHHLFKHLPKAGGHQVVQDGINGRAQVEEDPGNDVDVLVYLKDLYVVAGSLVHEAPHQAIGVKWSPADAEHDH